MSNFSLTFCFVILGCIATVFTDAAEVSRCYRVNNEQYCFYSGGTMSSWDAAREFCESKNSTLPIIRDENIDRVFQQFLDDSYNVIQNRSVWINARPANDSGTWHWINGSQSALNTSDFLDHSDNNWSSAIGTYNDSTVLYSSSDTDNQYYICQYNYDGDSNDTSVTSDTTSRPNVSCSPRWIVRPNSQAYGAWGVTAAKTQQQCLDACVDDSRCVAVEWTGTYCWMHDAHRQLLPDSHITTFQIVRQCNPVSDSSCDNAFVLNSQCYKVHSTERIPWFTAVNRCLSNNASLAVFDDNVRQYFPSSVLPDKAWIGLLKSRWTWPDGSDVVYNKFNVSSSTASDNPPPHPNSKYSCVVAAADQWRISRCDQQHLVTCQSDHLLPVTTTTATTTTEVTTTCAPNSVANTSLRQGTGENTLIGIIVGLVLLSIISTTLGVIITACICRSRHRAKSGHSVSIQASSDPAPTTADHKDDDSEYIDLSLDGDMHIYDAPSG